MRKLIGGEQGLISGYVIGLVLLVVVIGGGVLLLKNKSSDTQVTPPQNEPAINSEKNPSNADGTNSPVPEDTKGDNAGSNPATNETEKPATEDTGRGGSTSNPATDAGKNSATENSANGNSTSNSSTTLPSDAVENGARSNQTATIVATGPEDILASVFGLFLVVGASYALWNYRLSCGAIKRSLLK